MPECPGCGESFINDQKLLGHWVSEGLYARSGKARFYPEKPHGEMLKRITKTAAGKIGARMPRMRMPKTDDMMLSEHLPNRHREVEGKVGGVEKKMDPVLARSLDLWMIAVVIWIAVMILWMVSR